MSRRSAAALILLIAAAATGCVPRGVQVPQSPLLSALERKSGMIAYIGRDGNVHVTDQSGRNPLALTDDAVLPEGEGDAYRVYHLPTWSPDSDSLAYVSLAGTESDASSELLITTLDRPSLQKAYESSTELPFYLYWSPDNETVGFLSTSATNQMQVLQTAAVGRPRQVIDVGTDYFWSWAPDGRSAVIHASDASMPNSPDRLGFLSLGERISEFGLDLTAARFQAPAWSPDGSHILVAAEAEDRSAELMLLDSSGKLERSLNKLEASVAFAWSRDGQRLAYIVGDSPTEAGALGPLHVIDLASGAEHSEESEAMAFFWSPNGEELAYFIPQAAEDASSESAQDSPPLTLQLNVLDVDSGESRVLLTFQPSSRFAELLPYFDQFHQSMTIWSPDNRNLVLSFVDEGGLPGIAVVAASGSLQPRYLAEGTLGVWSWR